jgi:hypothetical protein
MATAKALAKKFVQNQAAMAASGAAAVAGIAAAAWALLVRGTPADPWGFVEIDAPTRIPNSQVPAGYLPSSQFTPTAEQVRRLRTFYPPHYSNVTRLFSRPSAGLLIFNTSVRKLQYWDGARWMQLSSVRNDGLPYPHEKLGATFFDRSENMITFDAGTHWERAQHLAGNAPAPRGFEDAGSGAIVYDADRRVYLTRLNTGWRTLRAAPSA